MTINRPIDFPKLKDYKPTRFMAPTSHYDKAKADRAVLFIESLKHTKGKWEGKQFYLLPWQEQIIRDIFELSQKGKSAYRVIWYALSVKMYNGVKIWVSKKNMM